MRRQELVALWRQTLEELADLVAHELKDSLNGVSLNLEVIRSRSERGGMDASALLEFTKAAAAQFEALSDRTEALLFLARPHAASTGKADVARTLKHLATLMIPATVADGGTLTVSGWERATPSAAPAQAVRLALAAGLMALTKEGGVCHCRLEAGPEPVVRFSHESAGCSLAPAIADALSGYKIRSHQSDNDLLIVFPGS